MAEKPGKSDKDASENKPKTQKRKLKDLENSETQKKKLAERKKIIPSFCSADKRRKNASTLKRKSVLKKNSVKAETKDVKTRTEQVEEKDNKSVSEEIINTETPVSDLTVIDSTAKDNGTCVTEITEQNVEEKEEPLSMIVNRASSPKLIFPSVSNETNKFGECKDNAISDNKDISMTNKSEVSNITETNVTQVSALESDFKPSAKKIESKNEHSESENFDLIKEKTNASSDANDYQFSEEQKYQTNDMKKENDDLQEDKGQLKDTEKNSIKDALKLDLLTQSETCLKNSDQDSLIQCQNVLNSVNDSSQSVINKKKENESEVKRNDQDSKSHDNINHKPVKEVLNNITNSQSNNSNEIQPAISIQSETPNGEQPTPATNSDHLNEKDLVSYSNNTCQNDTQQNNCLKEEQLVSKSTTEHQKILQQDIKTSNENLNEMQLVINPNNESNEVDAIPSQKNSLLTKPPVLTVITEKEEKEFIQKSNQKQELNQTSNFSGTTRTNIKDPGLFEDEDSDLTDSQLCETEWTIPGDALTENPHSKKSDYCLSKFKKAEREGTQIVSELITELSRLNKLVLNFKREMDIAWKRKGNSVPNQQNIIKKRPPVQTFLGQFR